MVAGSNMVTTIIGFGMSVVFTVFVCVKLICGWLCRGADDYRSRSAFEFDDAHMSDVEQVINLRPTLCSVGDRHNYIWS